MRTAFYSPDSILRLLRIQKIATLPELFRAVGSDVPVTIFRMLKERVQQYLNPEAEYWLDWFPGCPQEFGGTRILGGFPENHQFGPERSHSLSLQQQVAQVL